MQPHVITESVRPRCRRFLLRRRANAIKQASVTATSPTADELITLMGCLHDPANVQQTSSKCNAGRLLEVCWKFAGRLLPYVIMELDVCWTFAGSYKHPSTA